MGSRRVVVFLEVRSGDEGVLCSFRAQMHLDRGTSPMVPGRNPEETVSPCSEKWRSRF